MVCISRGRWRFSDAWRSARLREEDHRRSRRLTQARNSLFWQRVKRFAIESGDHPVYAGFCDGLLESCDLRPADARFAALQLNQPDFESIGIFPLEAECNRID